MYKCSDVGFSKCL